MRFKVRLLFALIMLVNHVTIGQTLYSLDSPNPQYYGAFGNSVCGKCDIDGDGINDIIASAYNEDSETSPNGAGRAYVYSGATGSLMYTLISPNETPFGYFGSSVAGLKDINNDGCDEIIVGAPHESEASGPDDAGRAYVFDGATGTVIYTLSSPNEEELGGFGNSVSGIGDINNDGYHDIVVGAPTEDPEENSYESRGRAYTFSGATGALIYTILSPNDEREGLFGYSVSEIGDINSDGCSDIIVAAWIEDLDDGPENAGRVYIISGANGEIQRILESPNETLDGWFGISVARVTDLNNDGCDDILIGARGEWGDSYEDAGRAYAFSGATGDIIYTFLSPNEQHAGHFGSSVSGASDLNGDPINEIVIGAPGEALDGGYDENGRAYVFDGATGTIVCTLVSPTSSVYGYFGTVSGAGDLNGDGFGEVVVGAEGETSNTGMSRAGRVHIFSGMLIPVELVSFYGELADDGVCIRWRTESEERCFGFNIYRREESDQARRKINDHPIPGGGTTAVPRDYSYLDVLSDEGTYYYWLEEIAENGYTTEYGPTDITIGPSALVLLGPYPNPVRDETELRLSFPQHSVSGIELSLHDLHGRQIGSTLYPEGIDIPVIQWRVRDRNIRPGVYRWKLTDGDHSIFRTMIVIR